MHKKKQPNSFIKYSGLGFQMALPIVLGVVGGIKLDEAFDAKPLWTVVLSLIGVFAGMYLALKDFIKNQDD